MGQTLLLLDPAKGAGFIAASTVRHHHPSVVCWNNLLHFLVPMPGPDLIDRGLVGVESHQVGVLTTYFPTSIVGADHWRFLYRAVQLLIDSVYFASGGAALQGHGHVQWRFGDFLRAWCLAEGEDALPGPAAGALGIAHPSTFGKWGSLTLCPSFQFAFSTCSISLLAANWATWCCSSLTRAANELPEPATLPSSAR
jgi:hypothetical protein